jgi:hypothetical protein
MNIHHRLKKIIEDENISISKFERIIGAGSMACRPFINPTTGVF